MAIKTVKEAIWKSPQVVRYSKNPMTESGGLPGGSGQVRLRVGHVRLNCNGPLPAAVTMLS